MTLATAPAGYIMARWRRDGMELKGLNMARMVEELANGVRVYQVTD